MLSVLMAIITLLLALGLIGNVVSFGVFCTIGNNIGVITCCYVFVLYLGIIIGCVYFYNLNKCDTYSDEKRHFEREISQLEEDKEWYEKQLESYKKLDKYKKEHCEFELKQSELEEENEKLRNIIRTQNNIRAEDFAQYLKIMLEDKNE